MICQVWWKEKYVGNWDGRQESKDHLNPPLSLMAQRPGCPHLHGGGVVNTFSPCFSEPGVSETVPQGEGEGARAGGKGNIHRLQLQRSAFIAVPNKVRTLKPVSRMIVKAISDFRIL